MKRTLAFAFASVVAACSGGSDPGGANGASSSSSGGGGIVGVQTPAALSEYCTVQAKVDLTVLTWASSQAWAGQGEKIAAGSNLYLAYEFGGWEGYVIEADGVPGKLRSTTDASKLVPDTDFTGSCPQPGTDRTAVLLQEAHVYATEDLAGTPCAIPAGMELPDFGYAARGANVGSLQSSVLQGMCGFASGYTKDLAMAPLVRK